MNDPLLAVAIFSIGILSVFIIVIVLKALMEEINNE